MRCSLGIGRCVTEFWLLFYIRCVFDACALVRWQLCEWLSSSEYTQNNWLVGWTYFRHNWGILLRTRLRFWMQFTSFISSCALTTPLSQVSRWYPGCSVSFHMNRWSSQRQIYVSGGNCATPERREHAPHTRTHIHAERSIKNYRFFCPVYFIKNWKKKSIKFCIIVCMRAAPRQRLSVRLCALAWANWIWWARMNHWTI